MIKTHCSISICKEKGKYQFFVPLDAPLGEIHDAIHEIKDEIIKMMLERNKSQSKQPDAVEQQKKCDAPQEQQVKIVGCCKEPE